MSGDRQDTVGNAAVQEELRGMGLCTPFGDFEVVPEDQGMCAEPTVPGTEVISEGELSSGYSQWDHVEANDTHLVVDPADRNGDVHPDFDRQGREHLRQLMRTRQGRQIIDDALGPAVRRRTLEVERAKDRRLQPEKGRGRSVLGWADQRHARATLLDEGDEQHGAGWSPRQLPTKNARFSGPAGFRDIERLLARRIRPARKRRQWTQAEFAGVAGRSGVGGDRGPALCSPVHGQISKLLRVWAALGHLRHFEALLGPPECGTLVELWGLR